MKHLFALLTSIAVLAGALTIASFAVERPVGEKTDSNVPELTVRDTVPSMDNLISRALSTSPYCSVKGILDTDWKTAPNISEANQRDIANHLKYGFSVAGVGKLQRSVYGAIDGYWNTGNAGTANTAGASMYGAFAYYMNEYLYNYKGEAVLNPEAEGAEYETAPEGFIYQMLLTYNFGCVAEIDCFGWYLGTILKSMPQAADVYVSNNGTDWTLVGYYDRVQRRIDGTDYTTNLTAAALGPDNTGKAETDTGIKIILFNLPEGTKAQFLRIACTAGNSVNDNYSADSAWGSGLRAWNDYSASGAQTWREMFVFGTKTSEVAYIYDPSTESEENDTVTTEKNTETETIPIKVNTTTEAPDSNTSEAPGTGTNAATGTETTGATEKPKSGCASSVLGTFGVAAMLSGAVILMKRRKQHR